MLGRNTNICVDANGTTVPVSTLRVGDAVFNLLTNRSHEITGIKSRAVVFDRCQTDLPDSILQPVRITKGSLDGVRPLEDLITSPAQQIFVDKTPKGPRAVLSVEMAFEQVSPGKAHLVDCASERYFAIFTSGGCAMLANGLLVQSYCSASAGG